MISTPKKELQVVFHFLSLAYPNVAVSDLLNSFKDYFFKGLSFDMTVAALNYLQTNCSSALNRTSDVFLVLPSDNSPSGDSNSAPNQTSVLPSNNTFHLKLFDVSSITRPFEYVFVPKNILGGSVVYRCYVPTLITNFDEYLLFDCSRRTELPLSRLAVINLVGGRFPGDAGKRMCCIYELDEEKTNKRVFVANVVSPTNIPLYNPIVCVCDSDHEVLVYT
jgi:hypothetical protein